MNLPSVLHKNLLPEQYIATDRINNSDFKVIDKTLLRYKQKPYQEKKSRTMAMEYATQFTASQHYVLLDHYCVAPKFDECTKEGNLVWPDLETGGKITSIKSSSATTHN